jgi:hypothetical protein
MCGSDRLCGFSARSGEIARACGLICVTRGTGDKTYVGGPKNGTFSECGTAYLDNGDGLKGIGQGTYESKGKHQWRTESFMQLSDGRRIRGEGEMNLASRSWKGMLYEMS